MAREGLHSTFSSQARSCARGSTPSRNRGNTGSVAMAGPLPARALKVSSPSHTQKSGNTAGLKGRDKGQMLVATRHSKNCRTQPVHLHSGREEAGQWHSSPPASSQTRYGHLRPNCLHPPYATACPCKPWDTPQAAGHVSSCSKVPTISYPISDRVLLWTYRAECKIRSSLKQFLPGKPSELPAIRSIQKHLL